MLYFIFSLLAAPFSVIPYPELRLTSYQDRLGGNNWTHFYNDVATLESRHAFTKDSSDVALSLFEIYFKKAQKNPKLIVGDEDPQKLNQWICDLAKVGFHLHV